MIDYSDMSLRQLYDELYDKFSKQFCGVDNTAELKLLKLEADKRDVKLYDRAYEEAIKSYIPPPINHNNIDDTPSCIIKIRELLNGSSLKIAEVIGSSMVNRNILEGNYVLYDEKADAIDGNVIIAEYKKQKFIKNYYFENGKIILRSSNLDYSDIIIESEADFKFLGVVQMVLNKI